MEVLIKAAAAALTGCAAALAVRKTAPETSFVLSLAVAAVILFAALDGAGEIVGFLKETAEAAGVSSAALAAVLKAVGVAVVTRFTADLCREAGSLSAASAVEWTGAVAGVCAVLPLMRSVLGTVRGLL